MSEQRTAISEIQRIKQELHHRVLEEIDLEAVPVQHFDGRAL